MLLIPLVINEDESIAPGSNVHAVMSANGADALVQDIVGTTLGSFSIYTPKGDIKGDAVIYLNKGIGAINLQNYSQRNLVVGETVWYQLIQAHHRFLVGTELHSFSYNGDNVESTFTVHNHGLSDILLRVKLIIVPDL